MSNCSVDTKDKNKKKESCQLESSYKNIFTTWRNNILVMDIHIIFLSVFVEVLFMFLYLKFNLMQEPIDEYISLYIIRPFVINILFYVTGKLVYKIKKLREEIKLILPLLILIVICSNLIIVHSIHFPLYIIHIIPLFASTMYGNVCIEKKVFIFSVFALTVSFVEVVFSFDTPMIQNTTYFLNMIIAYIVLIVSHVIAKLIIKSEKAKEHILEENFSYNNLLKEELLYDGLTRLYNHTALFNLIEDGIVNFEQDKEMQIAVLDIDFFKKVNDEYGHEFGNIVLCELSKILKKNKIDGVYPSRYGGEEFAILFYGHSINFAYNLLEIMRYDFENTKYEEIKNGKITFSAGLASYKDGLSSSEFFDKADAALYRAKKSGRNNVQIFVENNYKLNPNKKRN